MIWCFTVNNDSVAIVERFGKFVRIAEPGLNFINCLECECPQGTVSMRVKQLDVTCETKTKDNVFVVVNVSVQFQVDKVSVEDAFYKLANPASQITAYVYDVIRSTIPKILLDDVFDSKDQVAQAVLRDLKDVMKTYGFNIINALVTDISPNSVVKASMNEINAAQRIRAAAYEKGEAEKILVVKNAEAQSESTYLSGVGIARQRQAIMQGLQESVSAFNNNIEDVSPHTIIQLLLMTQYFDMMQSIGANSHSSTVFVPHNPSAVSSVGDQLRDALMQAQAIPSKQEMNRAQVKSNQVIPHHQ